MDLQDQEIAIRRWFDLRRRAIAQLMCAIVYCYIRISRKRKISYSMSSERERVREEVMSRISNCKTSRNIVRMSPQTFLKLCDMLEREGGLRATRWSSVEEQVAKTLYILTHNAKNREVNFWFRRSGETISRHLHQVLKAIIELEEKFIVQPDGSTVPLEISSSTRFYPYFKDCVGAIDGTHIRVKVSAKDAPRYRGRKEYPTQNVLAACTFDLKFTYVLAGWEGSTSDSRIIKNALTREDKLKIPQGKYYLVDAGFMLTNPDEDLIAEVDAELANQNLMASKKQLSTNNGNSGTLSWNRVMDDALVDGFMHEFEKGNKVNGTFTTTAYDHITAEIGALFGNKIDKVKIKNRWKTLKKNFTEYYDIFKGDMSGFSWNKDTQLWDAEPEVWDALIESKPKAANWRNVPLPNYEKMLRLYGPNRADGDLGGTVKESRKQGSPATDEDFAETIQDIDGHVARNEVNLESFDAPRFDFTVPETQSPDPSPIASGSKRKKLKVVKNKESNNEMIDMKESMNMVAEALREGNEIMRERQKYELPPISGEEAWNLIKDCGCETASLPEIYCAIMKDVGKLRTILQCPLEARKAVIMQLVFGSSD
ncbi:putative nuclease HARBI1 [Trifolium repens]|nr:putative nuclease HARBI1 [Trifolium repens]